MEVVSAIASDGSTSMPTHVARLPSPTEDNFHVPTHTFRPPDGGVRAWLVMLASFLCNGIIFGTINTSGILYDALLSRLEEKGVENPATKASMAQSLAIGTTFLLSMPAGILTDRLGIRITTFIGGTLAVAGMFASSILFEQIDMLIVSYGVVFGIGASLAYTPSLVILGHYFKRWLGLVNGFVTAGSSVFTIGLPFLLKYFITQYGLQSTYQLLTGLMGIIVICGIIFKPLMPEISRKELENSKKSKSCNQKICNCLQKYINFQIWRNKRYVIWALAIPSALFGYFVPYIHVIKYIKLVLGDDVNAEAIIQCIGITSGIGRVLFGYVADKPWVNRIYLQQISFFCIGTLTMLLTASRNFYLFLAISLGMGLFDGCFISLLGPIAFDIVGHSGASQAIGCLLALCAIPLTTGPALAGKLYDILDDYTIPFICAGIPPIIGSLVLFIVSCSKPQEKISVDSMKLELVEQKNNEMILNENATDAFIPLDSTYLQTENSGLGDEEIKVDVRLLAASQRESCV